MQEKLGTGTVSSAASRIMGLMDGTPAEEPEKEPEATHPEEAEPEVDAEAEETPTEAETEEEESPITLFSELADHLNVEESFLEDLIVPTKVNGQERQATIKDLVASFQKGESADAKLMDLAEQRKTFEAETQRERSKLKEEQDRTTALFNELFNLYSGDDMSELEAIKASDPERYNVRMAERHMRMQRLEQARQHLLSESAQKINENYRTTVENEKRKLMNSLSEWNDERVAEKEQKELRSYLLNSGFQDWEIDGKVENGMVTHTGIVDHRAVILARKAMLYDKSKTNTQPKKERLKALPKVGAGKPKDKSDKDIDKRKEARLKVRKTGRVEDAADIIKQIMEQKK